MTRSVSKRSVRLRDEIGPESGIPFAALSRQAFSGWEHFACSRRGTALMFTWAAAESTVWPIIPDFLLLPIAVAHGGVRTFPWSPRFWGPRLVARHGTFGPPVRPKRHFAPSDGCRWCNPTRSGLFTPGSSGVARAPSWRSRGAALASRSGRPWRQQAGFPLVEHYLPSLSLVRCAWAW